MSTPTPGPVDPDRYLAALGGRDPLQTLRKAPKRLKKLLKGQREKVLAKRPAPGKWSIKEVVAHLADGEVILGGRMRFAAAMDNPPIPSYDQDLFVERLGIDKVDTAELFQAFASMRALNVALLERLPEGALARTGLHAERGPESVERMLTMYAGHDVLHEQQIERLLGLDGQRAEKAAKAARKAEKEAARKAEKLARRARKAAKGVKQAAAKNGHPAESVKPARKAEARATELLAAR